MTNEITKATTNEAMSPEDQAIMEQLRQGSGEAEQGGGYTFVPEIIINNEKVEEEFTKKDGTKTIKKVLCDPMFLVKNKGDDGNYYETPLVEEFRAVVLAVRHYAQRKYLYDTATKKCINELDFYKTIEFKSFKSTVHVRMNKEFMSPMTYQEVKHMSPEGKENELWGVAYVLIEGEDTVRKVTVKGKSRGNLFDYITEDKGRSVSSLVTRFYQEVDAGDAFDFNVMMLKNTGETPKDLAGVLKAQNALNKMLDANETPSTPAVQGSVVSEGTIDLDNTKEALNTINGGTAEAVSSDPVKDEAEDNGLENMFKDQ